MQILWEGRAHERKGGNMSAALSLAAQNRMHEHQKMKELMRSGKHIQALEIAEQAIIKYGKHVGLLCDITCCQYELGFFSSCAQTLSLTMKEFAQASEFLSQNSSRRTALFIAKIAEELGDIQQSLNWLKKAKESVNTNEDLLWIEVQEIRILSFLGIKKDLAKILLRTNIPRQGNYSIQVEVLHSLMWTESCLVGFNQAYEIYKRLLTYDLTPSDCRLIHRDFLEICLRHNIQDPLIINKVVQKLERTDMLSFDRFLIELSQNRKMNSDYLYNDDLSVMQKIRILNIEINLQRDSKKIIDLKRKLNYLLKGLSSSSIKLLKNIVTSEHLDHDITISVSSLSLTAQQALLLTAFQNTLTLNIEEVVRQIWQEEFCDFHYDRLRMTIYKLNAIIQEHSGSPLFKLSKLQLSRSKNFRILD